MKGEEGVGLERSRDQGVETEIGEDINQGHAKEMTGDENDGGLGVVTETTGKEDRGTERNFL